MTPADLARRHPKLFHLTLPAARDSIHRHGLLSTSALLDLLGLEGANRTAIERTRRPTALTLTHATHGPITLNDQSPMTEAALAKCLDDGLTPADWIEHLNRRVFFWANEAGLMRLLRARANRGRALDIWVLDTLSLATRHADQIELSRINSGATIRKPARRGLATFVPLSAACLPSSILEVTVMGRVPDISDHLIENRQIPLPSDPHHHCANEWVSN